MLNKLKTSQRQDTCLPFATPCDPVRCLSCLRLNAWLSSVDTNVFARQYAIKASNTRGIAPRFLVLIAGSIVNSMRGNTTVHGPRCMLPQTQSGMQAPIGSDFPLLAENLRVLPASFWPVAEGNVHPMLAILFVGPGE